MSMSHQISNVQQELLKLYSMNVSDEKLLEIKYLLAKYFANKATESMDLFIEENNLTEQDMINWSNEHNRIKTRN